MKLIKSKGLILKIETDVLTRKLFFIENNQRQLFNYIKSLYKKYKITSSLHQPANKTYSKLHKAFNKVQKLTIQ